MLKAFVLVRNLEPNTPSLNFGDFTIGRVGGRANELEAASSLEGKTDDWILEKSYEPSVLRSRSPVDEILRDIEDTLLLLRLYDQGDISFVKQSIVLPNGSRLVQLPYRAMNDLNSYSRLRFKFDPDECQSWMAFARGIRGTQSWGSGWFAAARRFFLNGGAKQFNPYRDDVDRIVDYATALEATLVPEADFNSRRIRERAAALIAHDHSVEPLAVSSLINRFYNIRSRIVHGSGLKEQDRDWLSESEFKNWKEIELRVRQILVSAVRKLPPGEEDRRLALVRLYDPTDKDRGDFVLQKFGEIKTANVRKAIAAEMARLCGE